MDCIQTVVVKLLKFILIQRHDAAFRVQLHFICVRTSVSWFMVYVAYGVYHLIVYVPTMIFGWAYKRLEYGKQAHSQSNWRYLVYFVLMRLRHMRHTHTHSHTCDDDDNDGQYWWQVVTICAIFFYFAAYRWVWVIWNAAGLTSSIT